MPRARRIPFTRVIRNPARPVVPIIISTTQVHTKTRITLSVHVDTDVVPMGRNVTIVSHQSITIIMRPLMMLIARIEFAP